MMAKQLTIIVTHDVYHQRVTAVVKACPDCGGEVGPISGEGMSPVLNELTTQYLSHSCKS
jgi:hypothetical protein